MTDNEIIKALECCLTPYADCRKCPYRDIIHKGHTCCQETLGRDARSLINRQKEEIERLKNSGIRANSVEDWLKHCNELRAEAIKEFAERLKEKYSQADILCPRRIVSLTEKDLDDLVKEMVGDA